MNQDVQKFLRPKDWDTLSVNSQISQNSKLSQIRVKDQKKKVLGNKDKVQKNTNNKDEELINNRMEIQKQKEIEYNNYIKEKMNPFQTMYSKDFKSKIIKKTADQRQADKKQIEQEIEDTKSELKEMKQQQKEDSNRQSRNNTRVQFSPYVQSQAQTQSQNILVKSNQQDQEDLINDILFHYEQSGKQIDIEKLLHENQDYISHVFGYCKCDRCNCAQHKCPYQYQNSLKFRMKQTIKSSYNRDYAQIDSKKKHLFNDLPECDQRTYDINLTQQHKIDLQSINRQDFDRKQIPQKINKVIKVINNKYETGRSNYNQNFIDYQQNKVYRPNVMPIKTVINQLPFYKQTSYNNNFMDFYDNQHTNNHYKNIRNTFSSSVFKYDQQPVVPNYQPQKEQFITTNGFATNNLANLQYNIPKRNIKQQFKPNSVDQYDGIYKSTFFRDYQGNQEENCPGLTKTPFEDIKNRILEKIQEKQQNV